MVLDTVAKIIAKTTSCNAEDIKPETELVALGVDSLGAITMVFELEEAFDIEIPSEIIPSFKTVNDIIMMLEEAC